MSSKKRDQRSRRRGDSSGSDSDGNDYRDGKTPQGNSGRFDRMIQECSKGLAILFQITSSIEKRTKVMRTSKDSRLNHQKFTEEVDKGKKVISKLKRRLKELGSARQSGHLSKELTSQFKKISDDFKNQYAKFEDLCKKVVSSEKNTVDLIRRESSSRKKGDQGMNFTNYDEDQIYAQANIVTYEEDDLARREEDIIHITHQIREVQAAYQEIDNLVQDQDEVVVTIADDTENARDNVERGLDQLRQADAKTKYCNCSKKKMYCYGCIIVVVIILGLGLYVGLQYS